MCIRDRAGTERSLTVPSRRFAGSARYRAIASWNATPKLKPWQQSLRSSPISRRQSRKPRRGKRVGTLSSQPSARQRTPARRTAQPRPACRTHPLGAEGAALRSRWCDAAARPHRAPFLGELGGQIRYHVLLHQVVWQCPGSTPGRGSSCSTTGPMRND